MEFALDGENKSVGNKRIGNKTAWRVDLGNIFTYNSNYLNRFKPSSPDSVIILQSLLSFFMWGVLLKNVLICFCFSFVEKKASSDY